ncbi:hypothetical protein OEZ85_010104 [Tetradesmus obliquus]|uniref:DNA (cytosine-5-)-methyltransferase n=1 Tax=Tetradesmus obliquus TaxID=3088 RepID=A0ABY8TLM4_TETOB|nr:hypothetical protein OEZ85_010104 [Tetradesmus obliquus]
MFDPAFIAYEDARLSEAAPRQQQDGSKWPLLQLDLFAGAGGLGHIAQEDERTAIIPAWAVDCNASPCATHYINNAGAYVFAMGCEELPQLLSKWWQALQRSLGPGWQGRLEGFHHHRGQVLEVCDVRIADCAARVAKGTSKGQTRGAIQDSEAWLEFLVRRASSSSAASPGWAWEHEALLQCDDALLPMRRFLLAMLADKVLPLPGGVGLLTGGPPCQSLTGLNRLAPQTEVLSDARNRLLPGMGRLLQLLQPNFLCIEQVPAAFNDKRQHGVYARAAIALLLGLGYQVRLGICDADAYGVPEARTRAIFLGALSGREQLPPLPAATHIRTKSSSCPKLAQGCCVGFACEADAATAYPPAVMGDILNGLPPVGNHSQLESRSYAGPATSVLQAYLRRPCGPGCRPKHDSLEAAAGATGGDAQVQDSAGQAGHGKNLQDAALRDHVHVPVNERTLQGIRAIGLLEVHGTVARRNIALARRHPNQRRLLTVRERANLQGFPAYHVFAALPSSGSRKPAASLVNQRYDQVGNAVSPLMAAALGRCFLAAAAGRAPPGQAVLRLPDPAWRAPHMAHSNIAAAAAALQHGSMQRRKLLQQKRQDSIQACERAADTQMRCDVG